MDSTELQQRRNIIIVGGGIIGCTTAYFLTRHPAFNPALHKVTVLEASSIAAGASGKAGGLLALWAYPECLVPLSYRLHAELAAEHNGAERWGYRRLGCGSIAARVRAEDLKKRPQRAGMTVSGLGAVTNGNGEKKESSPGQTPLQPSTNGINGTKSEGELLPIQTSDPPQQSNQSPEQQQDWNKLPKQDASAASQLTDSSLPPDLDYIDPSIVLDYAQMGSSRTANPDTAQVHPYHFTTAMAQLARERGVNFLIGAKVTKINHSRHGVGTVEYEDRGTGGDKTISDATDVVVTAGPWTGRLLPKSKVEGIRAHSVVYDAHVGPYAVFTNVELPRDWAPEHRAARGERRKHKQVDPEIYARPFGEVYACGETDATVPLPETADQVQADEDQCDDLSAYIAAISPQLAAAPIKAKQACYLPRHIRFGEERGPLIGPTAVPGLWIAAGHTCWGIQNGPATGCLMAEMLLEGRARSADVDVLHPSKFRV
ncbi:FAD dependent oxidoreductase [Coniochaeta sp. 2T2.1]|nr:FAD dependent oxidoreductase [Coniochaeta sp. 2T2.1]